MKKYFLNLVTVGLLLPSFTFAVGDGTSALATRYKSPYFINISWSNPQVSVEGGTFTTSINLKSKTRKTEIFLDDKLVKTCLKKFSCAATFKNFTEEDTHEYKYRLTDAKGKYEEQVGTFSVLWNPEVAPVTFTANGLNIPVGKSLSLLAQLKEKKNIFDMGLHIGGDDFGAEEDYRISAKNTYSNGLLEGPYTTEDSGERLYTFVAQDGKGNEYRTSGVITVE